MRYAYIQLRQLSESLIPTLRAIRQQEFYPEPRFHASIAWALLDRPASSSSADSSSSPEFVTIPDFPVELISEVNGRWVLDYLDDRQSLNQTQIQTIRMSLLQIVHWTVLYYAPLPNHDAETMNYIDDSIPTAYLYVQLLKP
jgi:hypothetical protein